jgi:lipopolysaccharide export system protein LptC
MGFLMELYEQMLAERKHDDSATRRRVSLSQGRRVAAAAKIAARNSQQSSALLRPVRGGIDLSLPRGDQEHDDDDPDEWL